MGPATPTTWASPSRDPPPRPEMCSGSEAGSYSRLIDFVYHSTLGLRVIKKKRRSRARFRGGDLAVWGLLLRLHGRRHRVRSSPFSHSNPLDGVEHVFLELTRFAPSKESECLPPSSSHTGPVGFRKKRTGFRNKRKLQKGDFGGHAIQLHSCGRAGQILALAIRSKS